MGSAAASALAPLLSSAARAGNQSLIATRCHPAATLGHMALPAGQSDWCARRLDLFPLIAHSIYQPGSLYDDVIHSAKTSAAWGNYNPGRLPGRCRCAAAGTL